MRCCITSASCPRRVTVWRGPSTKSAFVLARTAGIGRFGMAYVSCSLREHEVDVKVQQASLKNADIRTTMNIYTQAIPKAVREANRRVVPPLLTAVANCCQNRALYGCPKNL